MSNFTTNIVAEMFETEKPPALTPEEVALYCLDILKLLANQRSDVEDGSIVRPVPFMKRVLCRENFLSVIVQVSLEFHHPSCSSTFILNLSIF